MVQSTVPYSTASAKSCGVSAADTGFAMATLKFMKANVGALSRQSGLEVVLVGCSVGEEALEALSKRAWVEIGDECVYTQVYT